MIAGRLAFWSLCILAAALATVRGEDDFVNSQVSRSINLQHHIVRIRTEITAVGQSNNALTKYRFVLPDAKVSLGSSGVATTSSHPNFLSTILTKASLSQPVSGEELGSYLSEVWR